MPLPQMLNFKNSALVLQPANAAVSRGRGPGTITEDNAAPSITIHDAAIGEGNASISKARGIGTINNDDSSG